MEKISFSDVVGIGGIIFATVLLVLDKAGKLKGGWLFGLLCVAGAMTLFIALGNSWVIDAPSKWKLWRGGLMVCFVIFSYSGLAILISTPSAEIAKLESASATVAPRKLACQVMTVQFEPVFRFFQSPPVYFQRLDTALRVSLVNQTGKPVYIRGYSVAALRSIEWVQFKNADRAAFEPYAFGVMVLEGDKPFIRRFDLSANGLDYVMEHKPLNPDESLELWMFFISGLTRKNLPEISQFKFTFYDSAKEEFICTSAYSIQSDKGTVVGISTGDIKALDSEPIPPNLREEPAH
jgi:hypothetical protein